MGCHDLTVALLSLLSDILVRARSHPTEKDLRLLKVTVIRCDAIQGLCVSQISQLKSMKVRSWRQTCFLAIGEFVAVLFDPTDAENQTLLSSIGSHWVEMVTKSHSSGQFDEVSGVGSP
jgi:nucleolar pre-ribosomal-associated protein 1